MNLIPSFLRKPQPQPLPYVVIQQPRHIDGRYKPGRHPILNRKRMSVEAQLAVYVARTTAKQRRDEFEAFCAVARLAPARINSTERMRKEEGRG